MDKHFDWHSERPFDWYSEGALRLAWNNTFRLACYWSLDKGHSKEVIKRALKSKVSRFIQETQMFQKRKLFNVSVSCLMAFNGLFNGCLLPLLHPHTPINTEASIHIQHTKNSTGKIYRKIEKRNRENLEIRCQKSSALPGSHTQSLHQPFHTQKSQIESAYI